MMKRVVWLVISVTLLSVVVGCNGKGDQSAPMGTAAQRIAPPNADKGKELTLQFLQAVQLGDKKAMYAASNLTDELVAESTEKLIHPDQYNLTPIQRKDYEDMLRMSGGIDFFAKKLVKMFPKSAAVEIQNTNLLGKTATTCEYTQFLKITYGNKAEAMADKTGKPVRMMIVPIQHIMRLVKDRWLHEISFSSKNFEKIAEKDFTVLAYF